MKNAVVTVVYPQAFKFWDEFVKSIKEQTFKDFDLIVINDGCNLNNEALTINNSLFLNSSGNIAENRQQIIDYLLVNKFKNAPLKL